MVEPLFSVPVGWEVTTVAAIAARGGGDVQTGPFGSQLHAADYVEQGIPSVMPQNIGDNTISEEGIARISVEDAKRLTRYRLRTGDIVYSRRGDVEKRSLVRSTNDGWLCGTGCLRIRFGDGHVLPEYAAYYLAHPAAKEWVVQHAVGATMPNLNTTILGSLPFVLPPMPEQISIARMLGSLDDKIELNRRMNETLETMAQAIFCDWFVDFGPTRRKLEGATDPLTIMGGLVQDTERAQALADLFPATLGDDGLPEGWRETSLGAVGKATGGIIQTGPFGSQLHQSDYVSAGLPVVMPANLTYSGFRRGDLSYVSLETTERLNKHRLKTGDIVYGRRGDIGRKALIGKYNEGWLCGTGCLKISFPAKPIPAEYLFYSLDHQNTLDWIRARAIGATMPNLNTSTLAEMPLLYPSDVSLAAFEQMVKPTLALREENDQQNGTLSATRDLLLPKLMSGEIRLSEADDLMEAAQ